MALETDSVRLLVEFLANPDTSSTSVSLWEQLDKAYKNNPKSAKTQNLLNRYIKSVGDDIADISASYVLSSEFSGLSNSGKATVIRDIMGEGLKVGFGKSARISKVIYDELLKNSGTSLRATLGSIDEKRLNEIIKISIGDSLDGEFEKVSSFISGSFRQIVQTGNRETISITGYELKKRGVKVGSRRKTTSSDPCDYCKERSGVIVSLGQDSGDEELFQFHDHCRCELEVVVLD